MPYADKAKQREYQARWLAQRRAAWMAENGPCVDCGGWALLQVDHADAVTKVTHRVWSWSEERRKVELAKCVVRCQPCHVAKTIKCVEINSVSHRHAVAEAARNRVWSDESREKCRQAALRRWAAVRGGQES